MGEPIPLHQELHLPSIPPEMMEELEKGSKKEELWRRIVIDLNDGTEEKTV